MYAPFHHPRHYWAAALLMLPFFLQLFGFGGTALGGGLCGALFSGGAVPLAMQGSGFWYALMFMGLLAFQLMYGGFLLLARLLEMPSSLEGPVYRLGVWLVGVLGGLYLATRTLGLPFPSELGWTVAETAPVDPLGFLLVGLSLSGGLLLWGLSRQTASRLP